MADPEPCRALPQQLEQEGKRICGISWRSFSRRMETKSIPLDNLLAAPAGIGDLKLVSLQDGPVEDEVAALARDPGLPLEKVDRIDPGQNLDGLAALIEACDLVVTVSNVTAHMAGALGKPCWILACHSHHIDWRWRNERHQNDWYPTTKVIRQPSQGHWAPVMAALNQVLKETAEPLV